MARSPCDVMQCNRAGVTSRRRTVGRAGEEWRRVGLCRAAPRAAVPAKTGPGEKRRVFVRRRPSPL
eukprot:scaffold96_cov302-Prasinococcus_capsulatus_cf.AAC.11